MSVRIEDIGSSEWSLDVNDKNNIVQGLADIKQCLDILFKTKNGTDPLRYDFGSSHIDRIDLPINIAFPLIKKDLIDAATKYEPRVEKIKVKYRIDGSQIVLTISYQIKNTILTDQLVLTYGFRNT
jgi:uncharacterized protein